jgi:hypothetical protein
MQPPASDLTAQPPHVRMNADPLEVDFRRDSVRHAAFG